MIQEAFTYVEQTPDLETKLKLIDTLRTVTAGKVKLALIFLWTKSFNFAVQSRKLSITQRRGIISLIPKVKDKTTCVLENLQPISQTNSDRDKKTHPNRASPIIYV